MEGSLVAALTADTAGFFCMTELVAALLLVGNGGGLPLGLWIHMLMPTLVPLDAPLLGTSKDERLGQ